MSSVRSFVKFSHAAHDLKSARKYDESDEEDWRYVRFFGLFASFCALGFTSVAVGNKHWIYGQGYNVGLWDNCLYNVTQNQTFEKCFEKKTPWQSGVIGLLLFSVSMGFLATVLSTLGVCVSSINTKMYYFHSAGEIYFVCMLCSAASLLMYAVATEIERRMLRPSYGAGFWLAWLATGFFGGAAVCMCLDEVVFECRQRRIEAQRHQHHRVGQATMTRPPAVGGQAAGDRV